MVGKFNKVSEAYEIFVEKFNKVSKAYEIFVEKVTAVITNLARICKS